MAEPNIKYTCSVHGELLRKEVMVYNYETEKDNGEKTPWLARICLKCLNELYLGLAEKGVVGKVDFEILDSQS